VGMSDPNEDRTGTRLIRKGQATAELELAHTREGTAVLRLGRRTVVDARKCQRAWSRTRQNRK